MDNNLPNNLYNRVVFHLMDSSGWSREQATDYLNNHVTPHDLLKHISYVLGDLSHMY